MKNNKKILIIGLSIVILAIILAIIISIYSTKKNENNYTNIYYYNTIDKILMPEKLNYNLDSETIVDDVYSMLGQKPKTVNYESVIKNNVKLLGYKIEDEYLYVSFSDEYNGLSSIEQILFRAGLIWSITEIRNISKVKIYVYDKEIMDSSGEPIGFLSRENVRISPEISPDKTKEQKVTLYFTNEDMDKLVQVEEMMKIKQNQDKSLQIIEHLIKGPTNVKYKSSIPKETKIRNIKTEEGICYIDLSADFMLKRGNIPPNIAVFSVVNSLTELNDIERVQILIESEKIDLYGGIDISKPLEKSKNIMK